MLDESRADNVHILDQTLFLSSVTKDNSGDYVCTVTNQAGTGSSNVVVISVPGETISDVMEAEVCKPAGHLIPHPLVSKSFCCCSYRQYPSNWLPLFVFTTKEVRIGNVGWGWIIEQITGPEQGLQGYNTSRTSPSLFLSTFLYCQNTAKLMEIIDAFFLSQRKSEDCWIITREMKSS